MLGYLSGTSVAAAAAEIAGALKEICTLANKFPPNTAGIDGSWVYDPNDYDQRTEGAKYNEWKAANAFVSSLISVLRARAATLRNNPLLKSAGAANLSADPAYQMFVQSLGMDPKQIPQFIKNNYLQSTDWTHHGESYLASQQLALLIQRLCSSVISLASQKITSYTTSSVKQAIQSHPTIASSIKSLLDFTSDPVSHQKPISVPSDTPPARPARPRPSPTTLPPVRPARPAKPSQSSAVAVQSICPDGSLVPYGSACPTPYAPGSQPSTPVSAPATMYFCNGVYVPTPCNELPLCTEDMLMNSIPCSNAGSIPASGPTVTQVVSSNPGSNFVAPPQTTLCPDGTRVPAGQPCRISQLPTSPVTTTPTGTGSPYCFGTITRPGVGSVPARWHRDGSGIVEFQLPNNPAWYPAADIPVSSMNCNSGYNPPPPSLNQPDNSGYISVISIGPGSLAPGIEPPVDLTAPGAGVNGLGDLTKSDVGWVSYLLVGGLMYWLLNKTKVRL